MEESMCPLSRKYLLSCPFLEYLLTLVVKVVGNWGNKFKQNDKTFHEVITSLPRKYQSEGGLNYE